MRTVHRSSILALSALLLAGAATLSAQTPNIRVAGRVQSQFSTVSGDSSSNFTPGATVGSSFEIRRLRIQADVRIGENINMVLQPSFEMSGLRMRDAYLRVMLLRRPTSGLALTFGQEKKPFSRYELTSSNNLPSIERGARFRGVTGVVAQNNLLEAEGYIAHDLGANVDLWGMENRLQFKLGVYNGSGESANDVNNAKSFGARATAIVMQDAEARPLLRVGAAMMSRDRAITTTATSTAFRPDSMKRTTAIGLDLEYGDFRPGLHVIADFATGKALRGGATDCLNGAAAISCRVDTGRNTGNLRPGTPDSAFVTFQSVQVIGAWRIQLEDPQGDRLIKIIEPALRIDVTDPNTSASSDGGMLITPVLNIYFSQTTVMRAGLDMYSYYDATATRRSVRALRVSWQANF